MASQLSLAELLQASADAATAGDHTTAWRLTSEFGTRHWVDEAPEVTEGTEGTEGTPAHLVTEFHVLRAAVADRLELHAEAAEAVHAWRSRATEAGDHASAVLASSALCLVAMVVESDNAPLESLAPSEALLADLRDALRTYSPAGGTTGDSLTRHESMCLSLAAMGGLTCATSLESPLRETFRTLAEKFTAPSTSSATNDRILTRAQQLHADGEIAAAKELVVALLDAESPTTRYEAHDLMGYFALTAEDNDSVLEHWRTCAEIALELGAPLEGVHRAEQACQLLNAEGDYTAAYDLACRYDEACTGAPVSPALLNLQAVRARAALGVGNLDEARRLAEATADWSMLTPDAERTLACLTMASVAASSAGDHVGTAALLERSCVLYLELGRPLAASQSLRTAAREQLNAEATSRAIELMERARVILEDAERAQDEPMLSWHLGDWNEDMSAIWEEAGREDLALEYATRAAQSFTDAQDHSSAALNWVAAASLHLERGEDTRCDIALDRAHGELLLVPEEVPEETDGADGDVGDVGASGSPAWQAYHELRHLRGN